MFGLSFGEIGLVLIVFGIVFGWGFAPWLGEAIGGLFEGAREAKKALRDDDARVVVKESAKPE